jgi:hypothetical protein
LKAPARSAAHTTAVAHACRQAACCALACAALALPCASHAQFAATLGIDSVNRYRGTGTPDVGPVVRASAMADSSWGAYGGLSGLWRTRDAGLASADALVGWSGRLNALAGLVALSPDWGWDAAVHRTHYGPGDGHDFSEAMLGVLGPGWTLRTWYSPHYFGGDMHTIYTELDASHALDERWHAFGHLGWLRYGGGPSYETPIPDRVDTLVGIGATLSNWDLRLARDGIVAGHAHSDMDARRRSAAWILGASVAF